MTFGDAMKQDRNAHTHKLFHNKNIHRPLNAEIVKQDIKKYPRVCVLWPALIVTNDVFEFVCNFTRNKTPDDYDYTLLYVTENLPSPDKPARYFRLTVEELDAADAENFI